jgi:predicted nuclease with TOPRIM domain
MKLYEIAENYRNLQELLENEDIPQELVIKSLNEVGGQLEDKAENVAKLIKTLEVEVNGFEEEEKRLSDRRKTLENRAKGLKEYLDAEMKATGKLKFKGKLFSFNIQKNAPSVNVIDENLIPNEYFIKQDPVINKKSLLAALKNGEDVPGAEIKQTESLRIR